MDKPMTPEERAAGIELWPGLTDDAENEIRADIATAIREAVAEEWQPMETAPRDGTSVLLCFKKRSKGDALVVASYCRHSAEWEAYSPWSLMAAWGDDYFSHWRHLPPEPEIQGGTAPAGQSGVSP